mgnify:CR=1 FL=1
MGLPVGTIYELKTKRDNYTGHYTVECYDFWGHLIQTSILKHPVLELAELEAQYKYPSAQILNGFELSIGNIEVQNFIGDEDDS